MDTGTYQKRLRPFFDLGQSCRGGLRRSAAVRKPRWFPIGRKLITRIVFERWIQVLIKKGFGLFLIWDSLVEEGCAAQPRSESRVGFAHYACVHPTLVDCQRRARFVAEPLKRVCLG